MLYERAESGDLRARDRVLWPRQSRGYENVRGLCKTLSAEVRTQLLTHYTLLFNTQNLKKTNPLVLI